MKYLLTLYLSSISIASNAQVEISGLVKNYKDSVFFIREAGGFHNLTRAWRDNVVKVVIEKNGNFKVTIPEKAINTWCIKTDKGTQLFDLIKGKDLKLIADFSKSKPIWAINENADDFNYYSYSSKLIEKYYSDNNLDDKTQNKNIDSSLFYRKGFAQYKLDVLHKYKNTHNISETYYNWLSSQYLYEPYERTLTENIGNKITLDDRIIAKLLENGIHDDYAALNTNSYNDLIEIYASNEFKKKSIGDASLKKYFDFVADGDVISGSTKDVFLTRFMYTIRKMPDSFYISIFEKYNRIVSNEQLKHYIIDVRNDYTKPLISEQLNLSEAKSILDIFEKYKGKVIYVDFWASWCMPCRQEMPNAALLKNKLKGESIVFLYFGYNDKERAWIKARNQLNIEGEHYLLNETMIKEAENIFGINGIPHYAIISKEGKIVDKKAKWPKDVYSELLLQIEKK